METMNTDTPRTNESLVAILERDGELSEKNVPEALVKLCRAMEWQLGELTKLTEERDELRDLLQEEQRLHIQTLNERDEARQWESQALVARIQRDEWKEKYIQQNKDLGCEMMDPNGTIWDHAKKLQKDIAAINDRRDNFEENLRFELGGHPDSELWGDAGLIAATMRCVDALNEITDQRDRLAEALNAILNDDPDSPLYKIKEARAALAAWKEARSESALP
jgi:hypothetical protein